VIMTMLIVLVVGLVLAVAGGRFTHGARAAANGDWTTTTASTGSILTIVGICMTTAALLVLLGKFLALFK